MGDIANVPSRSLCKAFHYVSPMLYWGDNTYDVKDENDIKEWINAWLDAGWKKNEIILTYQSNSAANSENGESVLKYLLSILNEDSLQSNTNDGTIQLDLNNSGSADINDVLHYARWFTQDISIGGQKYASS